jgi:UDP-N-acetylmuramoylalanine--D-glutamate ligase
MSSPFDFKDKKVLVMGLGRFGGGVGVTKWLIGQGARVTVIDLKEEQELQDSIKKLRELKERNELRGDHLTIITGKDSHDPRLLDENEILVVNPAVKPDNEYFKQAQQKKLELTTEINLFFEQCKGKIIGVTGSNGKETVVRMIELMVQEAGIKPYVGGNIGQSLLEKLADIKSEDWVLLELSSFQLERLAWVKISPHIAVIINITPNHLDWHGTFEKYVQAKANILRWQKGEDLAILNGGDHNVQSLHQLVRGRLVTVTKADESLRAYLNVPGEHNLWNATIAKVVAETLGASASQIQNGLKKFTGNEHALEFVCERNGIKIYNDSEATSPQATIAALKSFNNPIVLIVGGSDKGVDLRPLVERIIGKVKTLITIGQTGPTIQSLLREIDPKKTVERHEAASLSEAVKIGLKSALPGDILLLSPACASYDMFENLQERGKLFKKIVCHK